MAESLRATLPGFGYVEWMERTGSTNGDLLQLARDPMHPARPWLLGAHLQDNGRGRAGRTWQNRSGANLMFSCAFDVFLPASMLAGISPVIGVATCEALRGLLQHSNRHLLTLKWPNDLQWKFSKLAGILVEATRAGAARGTSDHHVVIIGLGINLQDARALSVSLNRSVADWAEVAAEDEGARYAQADTIVLRVVRAWHDALNNMLREGMRGFPERYARVDHLTGQHLDIVAQGRILYSGIACGVNEHGQLLVKTTRGMSPVSIGEVSVRPWAFDGANECAEGEQQL